jgi:hypothetical protein
MTSRSEPQTDSRLGMAGREDSWNYANDEKWFGVCSANELVFACGEEHPTLSAQRALGLLVESFGPAVIAEMVGDLIYRSSPTGDC